MSLADEANPGQRVRFLQPQCDELASRVFFCMAPHFCCGAGACAVSRRQLIVEHMLSGGVYCTMGALGGDELPTLRKRIAAYIAADEDFVPQNMPLSKRKPHLRRRA